MVVHIHIAAVVGGFQVAGQLPATQVQVQATQVPVRAEDGSADGSANQALLVPILTHLVLVVHRLAGKSPSHRHRTPILLRKPIPLRTHTVWVPRWDRRRHIKQAAAMSETLHIIMAGRSRQKLHHQVGLA